MKDYGFIETNGKSGKVVLVALEGYDIEHVIIPNAVRYINYMGYDKVQLKGLNGVDLIIHSHEGTRVAIEKWKQEIYKFYGLEL